MNNLNEILTLRSVSRKFRQYNGFLPVIRDCNFSIKSGKMVALLGPSGSGKSTLLHICGLLEQPDEGDVLVSGQSAAKLSDYRRSLLRQNYIGFVYQYHHLLKDFSALENVMIPQLIFGRSRVQAKQNALELLEKVKLSDRLNHRPGKLSGGEQQRVAIARALANNPKILLADEPTGNLDTKTTEEVFLLIQKLAREMGLAALIATHNLDLAKRMDEVMRIEDGKIHLI